MGAVTSEKTDAIVIGAGIGGLASAARLAAAGLSVTVLERHSHPGGKMRTLPTAAGPVDTGPTVLTMRPVFDDLFAALGTRLDTHLELIRQPLIARHFWPDGSQLDLFDDQTQSRAAIQEFAGHRAAQQFARFCDRARTLYEGFDRPVMQTPKPTPAQLVAHVMRRPHLASVMAPTSTLAALCARSFDDPRLAQLFGRYATYVGGSPYQVPALLSLIWQAEMAGVWVVRGGMSALARSLVTLAEMHGASFQFDTPVARLDIKNDAVEYVVLEDGTRLCADAVVFNGDPRALAIGLLGDEAKRVAPRTATQDRSLSAEVWAFAAETTGPELVHHNVFFRTDPKPEFDALKRGLLADEPTLYVCAMDRGLPEPPPRLERFEIIANAPPLGLNHDEQDIEKCRRRTFQTLKKRGLSFNPEPSPEALTTPREWERLFPGSSGSLYGQSPHGTMAAFQRPVAETPVRGLYLAGGGTHPGAGVPMATISGRHAAEAILRRQTSTSLFRPTAMHGGTSTASARTTNARSRSSPS